MEDETILKARLAIALFLAILMVTQPAGLAARTHGGTYIVGSPIIVWCSSAPHPIIPQGEPLQGPGGLGYFFSGEPECAHADADNMLRQAQGQPRTEWGYGGFVWKIMPSELGSLAVVGTNDAVFGHDASHINLFATTQSGDEVSSEGCGTQAIVLPPDLDLHWLSTPSQPLFILWTEIRAIFVGDDLEACFATTGTFASFFG